MSRFARAGLIAAAAALAAFNAHASVVTFETAPLSFGSFTGPVTENGFTYSAASGTLIINTVGHPGQDVEGFGGSGGGVLRIVSAGPSKMFRFSGLDYAAFSSAGTGSQTLMVTGGIGPVPIGTDNYTLANTNVSSFAGYANWTTEASSNLAGQAIDQLLIVLDANTGGSSFYQAVDNVVLTPIISSVPEPGSIALFGIGLFGIGILRRRCAT